MLSHSLNTAHSTGDCPTRKRKVASNRPPPPSLSSSSPALAFVVLDSVISRRFRGRKLICLIDESGGGDHRNGTSHKPSFFWFWWHRHVHYCCWLICQRNERLNGCSGKGTRFLNRVYVCVFCVQLASFCLYTWKLWRGQTLLVFRVNPSLDKRAILPIKRLENPSSHWQVPSSSLSLVFIRCLFIDE